MNKMQNNFIFIYGALSLLILIKGIYQSVIKKKSFENTPFLFIFGIFVWGDAVIFGLFWALAAIVCYLLRDWLLFLLTVSVFWSVRSLGESFYWIGQQFSTINRNPPEKLLGYRFFKNNSIWFVYQIFWQCITVISIVLTVFLLRR